MIKQRAKTSQTHLKWIKRMFGIFNVRMCQISRFCSGKNCVSNCVGVVHQVRNHGNTTSLWRSEVTATVQVVKGISWRSCVSSSPRLQGETQDRRDVAASCSCRRRRHERRRQRVVQGREVPCTSCRSDSRPLTFGCFPRTCQPNLG